MAGEPFRRTRQGGAWLAGERFPDAGLPTLATRKERLAVWGEPHRRDITRDPRHLLERLSRRGLAESNRASHCLGQDLSIGREGEALRKGVLVPAAQFLAGG